MHYDGDAMSTPSEPERRREPLPAGLILFRPGTDPVRRRRRQVFLAVYVLVAAFLVWPVFPMFSGIYPLILGLPFSLAWVVAALGVMFAALLWLHRAEGDD